MVLWRAVVSAVAKSSKFQLIAAFACIVAAVFMAAGATYAAAHDHEDHSSEIGGECIVCVVAAVGAAKASPDALPDITPNDVWIKARRPDRILIAHRGDAKPNPARGPPLSFPSF